MPDGLEKEQLENKEEVLLAASPYVAQPATPGPTIDKGFVPRVNLVNTLLQKQVFGIPKAIPSQMFFWGGGWVVFQWNFLLRPL